ncbi:MAG TPA: hypothetical protein PLG05_09725 [Bacteroidales bacterium]|nr:hypothetical protein [Bacteroidales bacterium]HOR61034.1 hypothetical protein [Bacteroidales bacterium]HPL05441.1 hypothetical protein [Bacteroidales bacterium]
MKKIKFLFIAIITITFFSCGGGTKPSSDNTDATVKDTTETEVTTEEVVKVDPFKDFPKGNIIAQAGDYVLTPSLTWQIDATKKGPESQTFIFYSAKMSEPGNEYSVIDFTFDDDTEIPNYMIIPIRSDESVKVGDIVLTWWQSGSGMHRAIVTKASDPKAPEVNYIDIDWDNSSTNKDGVGIGQMTEKIEPNTFHVLKNKWEAGTSVAVKVDNDYKVATIVNVSGDKVLTIGWAGSMKIYDKNDCVALDVIPNVKIGDEVQAPWVGKFVKTKVVKVDKKFGRVWCDDPYSDDPMIVPFGNIATTLDIK